MKYIDAEKLLSEIESRMEDCKLPNGTFPTTTNIVRYEELSCLHNFITSLQQEQPVVKDPFDDEQFRRGYEAGKNDAMREQKPNKQTEIEIEEAASPCEKVSIEQAKQIVDIADSIIDIYKTQVDALKTFTQMDNVASQGQLMVGMGIISQEEKTLIG